MPSVKKQISCRLSDESYDAVMLLINSGKYKSVSEYLYTLILKDLQRRETGDSNIKECVKEFLDSPEGMDFLSKIMVGMLKR